MTLELAAVEKAYDGFGFGPVDLAVGEEVLSVLGPSGGGKTTLLSVIAGIVRPDAGRISLDGRSLVGRPLEDRQVGMVFQEGALFPHMTARENVAYAATTPERVDELATMLEIDAVLDRRPASLSGGERQRVALARTLAADPSLLLLDEPLSSLDTPIRRRLRDELHDLFRSLDVPVIYVTHDQRTATVLGDRLAILRDGRIEQVGPPDAVLTRPATEFVARFTGTENVFDAVVGGQKGKWSLLQVGTVTLRAATDRPVGTRETACIRPSQLRVRAVTDGGRRMDEQAWSDTADEQTLTGTVRRRLNEGDDQRVVVDVAGADLTLTARVRASSFETTEVATGTTVRVSIPPDAVYVLPEDS